MTVVNQKSRQKCLDCDYKINVIYISNRCQLSPGIIKVFSGLLGKLVTGLVHEPIDSKKVQWHSKSDLWWQCWNWKHEKTTDRLTLRLSNSALQKSHFWTVTALLAFMDHWSKMFCHIFFSAIFGLMLCMASILKLYVENMDPTLSEKISSINCLPSSQSRFVNIFIWP